MEAQLEQLEGDRVRLTIEVPAGEIHHAVEHATHDLAGRVKIPGFRAGKVPEQVLLSRIGKDRLYSEAVESHIGSWFWSAVRSNRVRPTAQPDYSYELPQTPEESWSFSAEFPVQTPAEPADWTALEVPKLEAEVTDEFIGSYLEMLQGTVATLSPIGDRLARKGDVAVVDIVSDSGPGQRDYVVELGADNLVDELEGGIRRLLPGDTGEVEWELSDHSRRSVMVTLKELHEKVLPPLDDDFARSASEFGTLDELRTNVSEHILGLLETEANAQFRIAAVDELIKASKVEPALLVVEARTRDLINAFLRQLENRGIDPGGYLRMMGMSGAELEKTLRDEATHTIARELVLEGVADKLGLEISDDEIRKELKDEGESDEDIEEFMEAGGADRVRPDLRLKRAVDRIAAEVTAISQELADAREKIWTPGKEDDEPAKKLWTPGDKE
ncbi:MAG TPA: trigger factor [Gaiellaceae bacterium]